jgi:hypothetical protein
MTELDPTQTIKYGAIDDPVLFWTESLHQAIHEHRRQVWGRRLWIATILATLVGAAFLFRLGLGEFWWVYMLFGGGATARAASGKAYQATWELSELKDPRAVNVLAVAAISADKDTRDVASDGLMRVLPMVKVSDAELITDQGMEAMIALLGTGKTALLTVILKSFEQVGDERAIPAVERLANALIPPGDAYALSRAQWSTWLRGTNAEREQVRDAAKECLPYLQARAEQKRSSSTLLRAAQEPEEVDQNLLRPATSGETPVEQLLRPAI